MPDQRFLIAPAKTGLQLNMRPWMIMDDAFVQLSNVHSWRGRIKKRFGATVMNTSKSGVEAQQYSRFRTNIGTTDIGTGDFPSTTVPGDIYEVGQSFSIGDTMFTVTDDTPGPQDMLTTGMATGTFDVGTGDVVITGNNENPDTAIYYYPAEPVMALPSYQDVTLNDLVLFGFDTQFAYKFQAANGWQQLAAEASTDLAQWTGDDNNFYSTANYRGPGDSNYYLYVVNNNPPDGIRYWDGAQWNVVGTYPAVGPVYDAAANVILTALLVLPFKDRLLLLNTTEQVGGGSNIYTNRVRFCQNGSPVDTDAWRDDIPGLGGFIEAPTKEAIVASEFVKDRLIIYFERSTWELVYTNNQVLPFVFQKINTDLGVESTNSIVPFDNLAIGFGSTGVHACNGISVDRIDSIIPDQIFDVLNENSGPQRVCAVKDYFTEEVYWSYPSSAASDANANVYPNQILVYNYKTGAWAQNDDSITAFGYYQIENNITWADLQISWETNNNLWSDPSLIALFRTIVCGNQQGFTFLVANDVTRNCQSLSITDISVTDNVVTLTVMEHNLNEDTAYIYIDNIVGTDTMENLNGGIYSVDSSTDANTITIIEDGITGDYQGAGTIERVSQVQITSKQYNFYSDQGKKTQLSRIDFLVDKSANGEITFEYSSSFSPLQLQAEANTSGAATGTNILEMFPYSTFENNQVQVWRSVYPLLSGDTVQYLLFYSDDQMIDEVIVFSPFELHAVIFFARPTGKFGTSYY